MAVTRALYLDAMASTPVDPRVLEEMLPFFGELFANAASSHALGQEVSDLLGRARQDVAAAVGGGHSVVFASGATESNNLAIRGVCSRSPRPGHIVTSAIEHSSVRQVCREMARRGWALTELRVDGEGIVDPDAVERAIRRDTRIVSIMAANNEVGTLEPIPEIAAVCRSRGVPFHTDASQALGEVDVSGADLVSLSAHKVYGPKGIGALAMAPGVVLDPITWGGSHEQGLRPGTLNSPGIVGMAAALHLVRVEGRRDRDWTAGLRDRLLAGLQRHLGELVRVNGPSMERRLAKNLHVTIMGVCGSSLDQAIRDRVAVSAASACLGASGQRSHVLEALGVEEDGAHLRFGLGRFTTAAEVDFAADLIGRTALALVGVGCPIGERQ